MRFKRWPSLPCPHLEPHSKGNDGSGPAEEGSGGGPDHSQTLPALVASYQDNRSDSLMPRADGVQPERVTFPTRDMKSWRSSSAC